MDYDVIVVGAGPAGASAAYWLGQAGKRVLVLDKERLPRYKPCGGGIPKVVFDRFPFDFSPVVECEVDRVRFRFRDGREVTAQLPGRPIATAMRDRFDAHILGHARADVRDGSPVVALHQDGAAVEVADRAGQTFRARYVIGADGANSRVARLVGLRRRKRMGAGIEVEVPVDERTVAQYQNTVLFVFGTVPNGYLWVFPKAGHLSVGVGAFQGGASVMRQALRDEMARLGIDISGEPQHGHPLPIYLRHEPLRRERVLLVGDAAGLVDPLLGEGIRHAVDSGRLAAEAVLTDTPGRYTGQVHRRIGNNLRWGMLWARVFYNHPWGSFELGVRNPLFVSQFVRLFAGQTTYRRMLARAVPAVLPRLIHLLLRRKNRTEGDRHAVP